MPLFTRLLRSTLLAGAATCALAATAQATSFTVNGADTIAKSVVSGDTGTIASTGALTADTAITWTLNSGTAAPLVIDNAGTITATTRGFDTSKSASAARSLTFTNELGATIISGNDALRINNDIGAGTIKVDNAGLIQSSTGQALDFDAISTTTGTVTITNESTGVIKALDADAIRPGNSSTVNNYGQIVTLGPATDKNDAIDFQTANAGTVNNYLGGSITGSRDGITGNLNLVINNSGALTGQGGSGINMDTTSGTTTVVNSATGVITGTALNGADGDGVDIDWGSNITNYGTIKAVGLSTGGNTNEALALGGGTVTNMAGGVIISDQRAITVDNSGLADAPVIASIDNAGTITGNDGEAILMISPHADSLINRAGGVINGSVTMSAGDNSVTLYGGSTLNGALDGGAGTDTIHLTGTGQGSLSNVSNVEKLSVESANWTISGGQSYSGGVTIASGATAQVSGLLGGNVTNNGTVAVKDGSAQFNGTFQNNGAYISDPSTQSFVNLSVGANGSIQAAAGDTYQISGNFLSVSNQKTVWNTEFAILTFAGTADHTFDVTGVDEGAWANNRDDFAWGTLDLDPNHNLLLADSLGSGDAALYISGDLVGAQIAGDLVTNMFGVTGLIVYYNENDANNAYLGGLSYNLENGGRLVAAVPEPVTLSLFGAGLMGTIVLKRRKRRA